MRRKKTVQTMNTTKTALSHSRMMQRASTSSQEDELEDWIEKIKRSARGLEEKMMTRNITDWVETLRKLKWRQALRITTQSSDRWTRKAAEWNPGLVISTRPQRKTGRPAKRWEDDLNEFVTAEETQTTTIYGSVLQKRSMNGKRKKNNTRITF